MYSLPRLPEDPPPPLSPNISPDTPTHQKSDEEFWVLILLAVLWFIVVVIIFEIITLLLNIDIINRNLIYILYHICT